MYTVDYFIKKFEAIPEEKWIIGEYRFVDQRCALGHCMSDSAVDKVLGAGFTLQHDSGIPKSKFKFKNENLETGEFAEVYSLCKLFDQKSSSGSLRVIEINNGLDKNYQQPTPKKRILAALQDIKKMQQPNYEDITKELAILPTEETADQPIKEVI